MTDMLLPLLATGVIIAGIASMAFHWRESRTRWFLGFLTAGLLVIPGLALPIQAVQSNATKFSTCDRLLSQHPNGVAKSKFAANKAADNGFAMPKVSASLYRVNASRLDRDKDGIMCEQPQNSGNGQSEVTPFNQTRDYCEGAATIDLWNVPDSCIAVLRQVPSIQEWCRGARVIHGKVPAFCSNRRN